MSPAAGALGVTCVRSSWRPVATVGARWLDAESRHHLEEISLAARQAHAGRMAAIYRLAVLRWRETDRPRAQLALRHGIAWADKARKLAVQMAKKAGA